MKIESHKFREIIDSRTNPTVEAEINGTLGRAPAGASTGRHEAEAFVPKHLDAVEKKMQKFVGRDLSQKEFDDELREIDETEKFEELGSAAIAASFAFKNAEGFEYSNQFPLPLSNVIGGGEHGGNTSIQEFLVLPVNASSFREAVETNTKIYQELKDRYAMKIKGMNDEGALITSMDDEKTLKALKKVADKYDARIGLDMAASEYYENGEYKISSMRQNLESDDYVKFVQKLIDEFDLVYVEDPFHEDDFRSHAKLASKNPEVLICGDDLFVTQKQRLQEGIDKRAGNSLIVKPNQVGTVSDARETVELAKENDYVPVISHRSGETCDATISDLALEWEIPVIKAGIADIRIAKLNQLIRHEDRQENPEVNGF